MISPIANPQPHDVVGSNFFGDDLACSSHLVCDNPVIDKLLSNASD